MASTTAASSNLAGAWFGELASALQGTWQAVAASHDDHRPRQEHQQPPPQKLRRGGDNKQAVMQGAAAAGTKAAQDKEGGDVVRYGGAMSDTTLYLLLDRFSPS